MAYLYIILNNSGPSDNVNINGELFFNPFRVTLDFLVQRGKIDAL